MNYLISLLFLELWFVHTLAMQALFMLLCMGSWLAEDLSESEWQNIRGVSAAAKETLLGERLSTYGPIA